MPGRFSLLYSKTTLHSLCLGVRAGTTGDHLALVYLVPAEVTSRALFPPLPRCVVMCSLASITRSHPIRSVCFSVYYSALAADA